MPNGPIDSPQTLRAYLVRARDRWTTLTEEDINGMVERSVFAGGKLRSVYSGDVRERLPSIEFDQFMKALVRASGSRSDEYWPDFIWGTGEGAIRGCKPQDKWTCIPE
jgi:hypothetical protein